MTGLQEEWGHSAAVTSVGWGKRVPTPVPLPRWIGCISRGRVCTAASLWGPRPELSL